MPHSPFDRRALRMTVPMDAPYTASAYRSDSHEPLPPPKWAEDTNRSGNFDTHLAFGHYGNLEPAMEVTTQLQGEEQSVYQRQQELGKKEDVYCDARRWRFQNSSKIPHLLFILKLISFPFGWIAWAGILASFIPDHDAAKYSQDLSLLFFLVISAALIVGSLTLYMTGRKMVHHMHIVGFFICAGIVYWQKSSFGGMMEYKSPYGSVPSSTSWEP